MLEFFKNKMDPDKKNDLEKKIDKENVSENKNQSSIDSVNITDLPDNSKNDTLSSENNQPEIENENNQDLIHKKNGRLHIYVRQDKYKGELKSKNWVGRLYFNGKQKIYSSGTPILEDAIPVLEKWFDEIHEKGDVGDENSVNENNVQQIQQTNQATDQSKENNETIVSKSLTNNEKIVNEEKNKSKNENLQLKDNKNLDDTPEKRGLKLGMFDKLKNIKID